MLAKVAKEGLTLCHNRLFRTDFLLKLQPKFIPHNNTFEKAISLFLF